RFGRRALVDLLQAYTNRFTTRQAIRRCVGLELEDFESQYREFLQPIVESVAPRVSAGTRSFAELLRLVDNDPNQAPLLAELAEAYLQRRDNMQARKYAVEALRIDPRDQRAAYVLARLYVSIGDASHATAILEKTVSEDSPQENALALFAGLKLQAGEFDEAERLYRLGADRFPGDGNWLKSLTRVYLKTGDQRKLTRSLAELAKQGPENPLICKKLLELCLAEGDYPQAARWARCGLTIDVMDADFHAGLARARQQMSQPAEAADEFQVAVQLSPDRADWYMAWSRACVSAGRDDEARQALEQLLLRHPEQAEARELLDQLPMPEN
ncbi:MAG: tetratricopeptide repeat protein, partial [Planctomycetes bacterium]|nr:tetratricopeptide repeat protein [Planctomycetota bacterium]